MLLLENAWVLASVAQCSLKVAGLLPGQGACVAGSFLGRVGKAADRCFSLTVMFLSLSPPLFPSF